MYVGVGLVKTTHGEPQFQAWIGFPQQTNLDPSGAAPAESPIRERIIAFEDALKYLHACWCVLSSTPALRPTLWG